MDETLQIPDDVVNYIKSAFAHANDRVSQKMSKTPSTSEESLDISFIEALAEFAGPARVGAEWAVKIATHFIGRLRHFDRYEIADIGVVAVLKRSSSVVARKLVLLQSKRLYPLNNQVEELDAYDYELGLGKIVRAGSREASIFSSVTFQFTEASVYGALKPNGRQCQAIADHFGDTGIPVHYMMYNPVVLPWTQSYPAATPVSALPTRQFGARVLGSEEIEAASSGDRSPSVRDLLGDSERTPYELGSPVEEFFAEVVRCRAGYRFSEDRDPGLRRLFARKSGAIFCIVEVTIEQQL